MRTPRTLSEQFYANAFDDTEWVVPSEFSKTLEIELNEANQAVADYEEANGIDKMRIGWLEDELDKANNAISTLRRSLYESNGARSTLIFTESFKKIASEIDKKIGRH